MGTYLNPGNSGFTRIVNSDYVDKTGMIALINQTIDTTRNLICVSRPRRFGKSYAAQMLCAYYDKTVHSKELFSNYKIAKTPDFHDNINHYDVIYLDMTQILNESDKDNFIDYIKTSITEEIQKSYPEVEISDTLSTTLINTVEHTGNKFVAIIDEWDAPIRITSRQEQLWLDFLRMLFKSSGTTARIFAAAYMTGILPIKKDSSQSALSDFWEYTIFNPLEYSEYVGFTEDEVLGLCKAYGRDFSNIKKWYDGYTVGEIHSIYNPFSVMCALKSGIYTSYWRNTSVAETLMTYIDLDEEGLQQDIAKLIAGEKIVVDPFFFQNDVVNFTSKDDVLTLMIHLGYLTYEEVPDSYGDDDTMTGFAWIPNEEVRTEFEKILRKAKHKDLVELVKKSDQLLQDTIAGNEAAVSAAFDQIRDTSYAPTFYTNEQSLRYAVKMAYLSCVDQYARVEELPTGHGIADVVFIPKRSSSLPAMIVELKWDKPAEGAIAQIKARNYPAFLKGYGGDIILTGITYDSQSKKHSCDIEVVRS
ncbi:MAG: AAA family ATPase [Anaerolineaceae bacterium]|nr:AAA family ATPase [Anaerolineaceae bacterium]